MLSSITIPVNNGTYTWPNSNVHLQDVQGLGTPEPKRGYHEYSNVSGGIDLSQFHTTRRVSFDGYIVAQDIATFESVRQAIQAAFTFNNAQKIIKLTTLGGALVQGNAMIASGFQTKPETGVPTGCSFHVELDFSDPLFYSQTAHSLQGGVATLTGGIILPATLPFTLSANLNGILTATNGGTTDSIPSSVIIDGPGNSFTISNKTTGEDFFYSGSLITGDSVSFDFTRHTATLNGTTNEYGNVSGTWWSLVPGANTIVLTCGGSNTSDTQLLMGWSDAFASL